MRSSFVIGVLVCAAGLIGCGDAATSDNGGTGNTPGSGGDNRGPGGSDGAGATSGGGTLKVKSGQWIGFPDPYFSPGVAACLYVNDTGDALVPHESCDFGGGDALFSFFNVGGGPGERDCFTSLADPSTVPIVSNVELTEAKLEDGFSVEFWRGSADAEADEAKANLANRQQACGWQGLGEGFRLFPIEKVRAQPNIYVPMRLRYWLDQPLEEQPEWFRRLGIQE